MQYEDENGVNEPSRRRLLKGIGAGAGRKLSGRSCTKRKVHRGRFHRMHAMRKQPFMVSIRQGILTPQQAAMMLVAFDVLASDKADLERCFAY